MEQLKKGESSKKSKFLSVLVAKLGDIPLENLLTGKGTIREGEGTVRGCEETIRVGQEF